MGYGAACVFPAANLDAMLPQGHHTSLQDAADGLDVPVQHVAWFRIVAPMAGWTREDLVKDGAQCTEQSNFAAKQSLSALLYHADLIGTPVYNCFDCELELTPVISHDAARGSGKMESLLGDESDAGDDDVGEFDLGEDDDLHLDDDGIGDINLDDDDELDLFG
jgi:hypothetical protein